MRSKATVTLVCVLWGAGWVTLVGSVAARKLPTAYGPSGGGGNWATAAKSDTARRDTLAKPDTLNPPDSTIVPDSLRKVPPPRKPDPDSSRTKPPKRPKPNPRRHTH